MIRRWMLPTSQVQPEPGDYVMIRVRKKNVLVVVVALVLALLVVTPVLALGEAIGDGLLNPIEVCKFDGHVRITVHNVWESNYFQVCTGELLCADLGMLLLDEMGSAELPYGEGCVFVYECTDEALPKAISAAQVNGCLNWSPFPLAWTCDEEVPYPACPVNLGCEGGAGLYPPSYSGVPYNGYNDDGYFILVVDNHCKQYVSLVDVFIGDPLTEVMQVMTMPVDPNGWTQFSEDDIQNIRDTYEYAGEIWFKVHGIGDRYYGLHELMTHPNLGSG